MERVTVRTVNRSQSGNTVCESITKYSVHETGKFLYDTHREAYDAVRVNHPSHHGMILTFEGAEFATAKVWTTEKVELFLLTLAKEPWIEAEGMTVRWKRPAGSNSHELIPVITVRDIELNGVSVHEYVFGGGLPGWHINQRWQEIKRDLGLEIDIHWETALSIAAARKISPIGWATYDKARKGMLLMSTWTYLLVNPKGALGL